MYGLIGKPRSRRASSWSGSGRWSAATRCVSRPELRARGPGGEGFTAKIAIDRQVRETAGCPGSGPRGRRPGWGDRGRAPHRRSWHRSRRAD